MWNTVTIWFVHARHDQRLTIYIRYRLMQHVRRSERQWAQQRLNTYSFWCKVECVSVCVCMGLCLCVCVCMCIDEYMCKWNRNERASIGYSLHTLWPSSVYMKSDFVWTPTGMWIGLFRMWNLGLWGEGGSQGDRTVVVIVRSLLLELQRQRTKKHATKKENIVN